MSQNVCHLVSAFQFIVCLYIFVLGLIRSLVDPMLAAFTVCGPLQFFVSDYLAVRFSEQIMSKGKYPSIFSRQMEAIVLIILQIFFATRAVLKIGEYIGRGFIKPVSKNPCATWAFFFLSKVDDIKKLKELSKLFLSSTRLHSFFY